MDGIERQLRDALLRHCPPDDAALEALFGTGRSHIEDLAGLCDPETDPVTRTGPLGHAGS